MGINMLAEIVLLITITVSPGEGKGTVPITFGTVYDTMAQCEAQLDRSMKTGFKFYMMDKALKINAQCIERPIANQVMMNGLPLNVLVQAECK